MSSLVARNAPPMSIPVSATLKYGQKNYTATEFVDLARKLESMKLMQNAIGVTPTELFVTAHIGEASTREELMRLGFEVAPKRRVVYQLVRRADAARMLPESLADILATIQSLRHLAHTNFHSDSEINKDLMLGQLDSMISCWYMPGNGRQLSLVLPDTINPDDQRAHLDYLLLHSIIPMVDQNDPVGSFRQHLKVELAAWKELVDQLYSNTAWSIAEDFQLWIGSYLEYMTQQFREHMLQSIGEESTAANIKDLSAANAGLPTQSDQINTLREEMPGVAAVKDVAVHSPHGREQPRPLADLPEQGEVRLRAKPSRSYAAWRIPAHQSMTDGTLVIPAWALQALVEVFRVDQRHFGEVAGQWIVQSPFGPKLYTPEAMAYEFERM